MFSSNLELDLNYRSYTEVVIMPVFLKIRLLLVFSCICVTTVKGVMVHSHTRCAEMGCAGNSMYFKRFTSVAH